MISVSMNAKSFFPICRSGSLDEVRKALQEGFNFEDVDEFDYTALMVACMYNPDVGVIRFLVEAGCPVNELDGCEMSALHYAVDFSRSVEVVEFLIDSGADVNCMAAGNRSVLMSAAAFNHEAVPLLLVAGADARVRDEQGLDAVGYCEYFNYDESIINMLFVAGCPRRDVEVGVGRDLRPVVVAGEEEFEECVFRGDGFWVERLRFPGEYVINYREGGEWRYLPVRAAEGVDLCVRGNGEVAWVLVCRGSFTGENVFLVGKDGVVSGFAWGEGILDVVPYKNTFWVLYDDPIVRFNEAFLVEYARSGKMIGVMKRENMVCVGVCADGDDLYAMFEPGDELVRLNGWSERIECHQGFSEMRVTGKKLVGRDWRRRDGLRYEYEIEGKKLVLKRRVY